MSLAPHPFTPPGSNTQRLPYMPIETERLLASDLWHSSTGDGFKAWFRLLSESWRQTPAASLPDDHRILCGLAGVTPAQWKRLQATALHGWTRCSDGRLYHAVLAVRALAAWSSKLEADLRSARGNAKQAKRHRPPQDIERELARAKRYLERLECGDLDTDPERDPHGDRAGNPEGDPTGDVEATKQEHQHQREEEREHGGDNLPRPTTMVVWGGRVAALREQFADVLRDTAHTRNAAPLVALADQGCDWEHDIEPALWAVLTATRNANAAQVDAEPTRISSWAHPAFARTAKANRDVRAPSHHPDNARQAGVQTT